MPSIEAQLTPRERQVVGLLTDPTVGSKAEAARRLGLDKSTVCVHSTKPNVEAAIAARLEKLSDKAGGQLGQLHKIHEKALDKLEDLVQQDLTPELALLLVAKLGEATLTQLKIQELTPAAPTHPSVAADRERRRTARTIRAALWLAKGRALLGYLIPPPGEHTANVAVSDSAK